jgi:hypothetical protein
VYKTGFNWLRIETVVVFKCGNGPSCAIKGKTFFEACQRVLRTHLKVIFGGQISQYGDKATVCTTEEFRQGQEIFLVFTAFRLVSGRTQPPMKSETGVLSIGLKRPVSNASLWPWGRLSL